MLAGDVGFRPDNLLIAETPLPAAYADVKVGCPFALPVTKEAPVNSCLNFVYENSVRRRLELEGKDPLTFAAGACWHRVLTNENGTLTPLAANKKEGTEL